MGAEVMNQAKNFLDGGRYSFLAKKATYTGQYEWHALVRKFVRVERER